MPAAVKISFQVSSVSARTVATKARAFVVDASLLLLPLLGGTGRNLSGKQVERVDAEEIGDDEDDDDHPDPASPGATDDERPAATEAAHAAAEAAAAPARVVDVGALPSSLPAHVGLPSHYHHRILTIRQVPESLRRT